MLNFRVVGFDIFCDGQKIGELNAKTTKISIYDAFVEKIESKPERHVCENECECGDD